MNKQDKASILDMWQQAKKNGVNRYRFAWWLIQHQPNLVIEIIRKYLSELER